MVKLQIYFLQNVTDKWYVGAPGYKYKNVQAE